MTIDEAIKALKEVFDFIYDEGNPIDYEAIQLGIEALEKVKYLRGLMGMPLPLPSEKVME